MLVLALVVLGVVLILNASPDSWLRTGWLAEVVWAISLWVCALRTLPHPNVAPTSDALPPPPIPPANGRFHSPLARPHAVCSHFLSALTCLHVCVFVAVPAACAPACTAQFPWMANFPLGPRLGILAAYTALFVALALASVQRLLLSVLLQYKGFLYQARRPTLGMKLWLVALKALLGKRKHTLYSFQGVLPSLPVPSLKDTVARYLKSVRNLQSPEQFAQTEVRLLGPRGVGENGPQGLCSQLRVRAHPTHRGVCVWGGGGLRLGAAVGRGKVWACWRVGTGAACCCRWMGVCVGVGVWIRGRGLLSERLKVCVQAC